MMTTLLGLEVLLSERLDLVAGRRVGLVASVSSTDAQLISTAERLHQHPDVNLVALFGPEHGLHGQAQAGEKVKVYTDPYLGVPVYSLYGETYKPTREMLEDLDALIVDLQDGGVRFYTFLATMAHVIQAAAEQGLPVIVLDRPAPINAVTVEGPILDPEYASFVGPYPIPIRYGLTIGEMASLFNEHFGIGCDLTVVPLQNWERRCWFDETGLPFIPPSPNLPTLSALIAYPGTCLVEGSNISEGRGTTKPFEYIGAPWLKAEPLAHALNALGLAGVRFRPVYFTPTFSKYQGEACAGVHFYVMDRARCRPVETALRMLALIREMHPDQFAWREPWTPGGRYPIDLLTGGSSVREHLDANKPVSDLFSQWQAGLRAYEAVRSQFLLYPG
jgi:uncharacterized protein YbbC (DUF1343 family)